MNLSNWLCGIHFYSKENGRYSRGKISENQELIALGAANIASSLLAGFLVTGSLPSTSVNFNSGAITQAVSIYAAMFVLLASITLTPIWYFLPKATLAAIFLVLYRTSKPHVGLVTGPQYFKNVRRHALITTPQILSLRVDESLYFANASYLVARLFHYLLTHK